MTPRRCQRACTAVHLPSGSDVEVRLAGRASLAAEDVSRFSAVVFGAGDFRTRTEDRPLPPPLASGDRLLLGPLTGDGGAARSATRASSSYASTDPARDIWAGLAHHGRPIQYAHIATPLEMWDVWAPIAALPAAFEPPSASFALDWGLIRALRGRGHRVRHYHCRRRHFFDRRPRARPAAPVRRAVSHPGHARRPPSAGPEPPAAPSSRSAQPSCGHSSMRASRGGLCPRGRRGGRAAHWCGQPPARRGCHPFGDTRAGQQPLRAAARVPGRPDSGRGERIARGARLPNARVRRLGAHRTKGLRRGHLRPCRLTSASRRKPHPQLRIPNRTRTPTPKYLGVGAGIRLGVGRLIGGFRLSASAKATADAPSASREGGLPEGQPSEPPGRNASKSKTMTPEIDLDAYFARIGYAGRAPPGSRPFVPYTSGMPGHSVREPEPAPSMAGAARCGIARAETGARRPRRVLFRAEPPASVTSSGLSASM